MLKRLLMMTGLLAMTLSVFSVGVASATTPVKDSLTVTATSKAVIGQYKTTITVTGTYVCNFAEQIQQSGFSVQVTQIQKGGTVVVGGTSLWGGMNPNMPPVTPVCDGSTQQWSAVLQATVPSTMGPATWKSGKATLTVIANVSSGMGFPPPPSVQANVAQAIQVS